MTDLYTYAGFADGPHLLSHLTVRRGPNAGATLLYCTCEWETTAPTIDEAIRVGNQHCRLCGAQWGRTIG